MAGVACTALGALGWYFGSGLQPVVGDVAALRSVFAPRTQARWAALAALTAFALGALNQWTYLRELLELPLPVVLFSVLGPASMFMFVVLVFRAFAQRGQLFAAAWSVPVLWTAGGIPQCAAVAAWHVRLDRVCADGRAAGDPDRGTGGAVGDRIRGVAVAGDVGGDVVRAGVAAAVVARRRGVGARVGSDAWLRRMAPASQLPTSRPTTLRVGLLAVDGAIRADCRPRLTGARLLRRYATEIERLADDGARVVVLPETVFASDVLAERDA